MTPEEYQKLQKEQIRYGERYDDRVDHFCPPLVHNKDGRVSKRQPKVQKRTKAYWQAQCSFRGLKSSGDIAQLQDRLRNRVRDQDAVCKQRLARVLALILAEDERRDQQSEEQGWHDWNRKMAERVHADPSRALRAPPALDHTLQRGSLTTQTSSQGLRDAAGQLDVMYWAGMEPPRSMVTSTSAYSPWTIAEEPHSVNTRVQGVFSPAMQELKGSKARQPGAKDSETAQMNARHAGVVAQASRMQDWDLTGSWEITCEELATYTSHTPVDLSIEIFKDTYLFSDLYEDRDSDDEDGEESDGTETGSTTKHKACGELECPNAPRYSARFDFGLIEGLMRIFPTANALKSGTSFQVKTNPKWRYIWRGRDTGTGEIQASADENALDMTFGEHGTTVKGSFICDFLKPVEFTGRKLARGHGAKAPDGEEWRALSARAWDTECTTRWH